MKDSGRRIKLMEVVHFDTKMAHIIKVSGKIIDKMVLGCTNGLLLSTIQVAGVMGTNMDTDS